MTRPKVAPDKRQRTAQACDSCKRRKQKCNGAIPCNTCERRSLPCQYGSGEHVEDEGPPEKRRLSVVAASAITTPTTIRPLGGVAMASPQCSPRMNVPSDHGREMMTHQSTPWHPEPSATPGAPTTISGLRTDLTSGLGLPSIESAMRATGCDPTTFRLSSKEHPGLTSHSSMDTDNDEEAIMYTSTRMLEEPSGRLVYVGDSATLSFLQLMRMIVESVSGPSRFTLDPRRHRILENTLRLPQGFRHTHLLPDRKTADVLVSSFFTNTQGLLEVFDRTAFSSGLEASYRDPLNVDPQWLGLLNLVFAVGLVLACFPGGTEEARLIGRLRNDPLDRAEMFYHNAKTLSDPLTAFEDAGIWSIQALLLMTVYMLAISKRNTAFALLGMAIRSAFALGLHREETLVIYIPAERTLRRHLWGSLFVFDRFLSASMGRPVAISEDDCSESFFLDSARDAGHGDDPHPGLLGLEASVRSSHIIGLVLKRIYQKRKVSTRLAQEMADLCSVWPKQLPAILHWRQALSSESDHGIATLHVNLLYCHSIILLTRPFFLFLLSSRLNKSGGGGGGGASNTTATNTTTTMTTSDDPVTTPSQQQQQQQQRTEGGKSRPMAKFAEACVSASVHTIFLVQNAYGAGQLPQRNPFVIYFFFAAALIVLSNAFSGVCPDANNMAWCIEHAISVMSYCSRTDPQAERLLYILTTFRDVVHARHPNFLLRSSSSSHHSHHHSHPHTHHPHHPHTHSHDHHHQGGVREAMKASDPISAHWKLAPTPTPASDASAAVSSHSPIQQHNHGQCQCKQTGQGTGNGNDYFPGGAGGGGGGGNSSSTCPHFHHLESPWPRHGSFSTDIGNLTTPLANTNGSNYSGEGGGGVSGSGGGYVGGGDGSSSSETMVDDVVDIDFDAFWSVGGVAGGSNVGAGSGTNVGGGVAGASAPGGLAGGLAGIGIGGGGINSTIPPIAPIQTHHQHHHAHPGGGEGILSPPHQYAMAAAGGYAPPSTTTGRRS